MRTVLAMILCLAIGTAEAGEIFQAAVARGYFAVSPTSQAFYERTAEKDKVENCVVLVYHVGTPDQGAIAFFPETAEKIANEAEPYIMLHKRGRKVDETIEIDDSLSLSIKADGELSITVKSKKEDAEAVFVGDTALQFINGCVNAVQVAKIWPSVIFGQVPVSSSTTSMNQEQQNPEQEGFLNLRVMDADFSANEIAANIKYDPYKGKTVKIIGTVSSISQDSDTKRPLIFFKESIKLMPVTCLLADDASLEDAASLQPNQQIAVEGIWQGRPRFMEPTITNARIIK